MIPENLYKTKSKIDQDEDYNGSEVFLNMLTEIFDEFGLSKDLQEETKIKDQLINARLQFIETGDRFLINEMTMLDDQIEEGKKDIVKGAKFSEELGVVSKNFGALIDPKKTTVYQYYAAKTSITNG